MRRIGKRPRQRQRRSAATAGSRRCRAPQQLPSWRQGHLRSPAVCPRCIIPSRRGIAPNEDRGRRHSDFRPRRRDRRTGWVMPTGRRMPRRSSTGSSRQVHRRRGERSMPRARRCRATARLPAHCAPPGALVDTAQRLRRTLPQRRLCPKHRPCRLRADLRPDEDSATDLCQVARREAVIGVSG